MADVIMTCGRICSGKSTYAQKLSKERNAVVLSIDELTISLFPDGAGDMHDTYVSRAQEYLYKQAVMIAKTGTDVILDWGFWKASERKIARDYFGQNGINCELHYLDITDKLWQERISERNRLVREGRVKAYYVDNGLAEKFTGLFEKPDENEIDHKIIIN